MTVVKHKSSQLIGLTTFIALFALMGCQVNSSKQVSIPSLPELDAQFFGDRRDVPSITDITQLTEAQKNHFLQDFNDPRSIEIAPHRRLFTYLDHKLVGFSYRGDTLFATDALATNAGNCMSLAVMTYSLAKLAGVDVSFQMVNVPPVYKKRSDVMLLSYHVRSYLYDPWYDPEGGGTLMWPRIVIDYFPDRGYVNGETISENEFLALFYRNLAADKLVQGDLDASFWLTKEALTYAPHDPESINLMAVIYRRIGQPDLAMKYFEHGMLFTRGNINLMSNYHQFLQQRGLVDEAQKVAQKLSTSSDSNPYAWIKLGHEAYTRKNYTASKRYYTRALKLAPYLDDAHFGLAKALYQKGETLAAIDALKNAAKSAFQDTERDLYLAKLAVMKASQ